MPEEKEEKKKTKTEIAIAKLDKDFGKGSVVKMGDSNKKRVFDTIPTGSLQLDLATGIGGWPRGRIIEIYGPESSGKTTIATHAIAEAQKIGLMACLVDAEHAFDPVYAEEIGVDIDELYISQPMSGEQGLNVVVGLIETGEFGVIVIDSVAALVPQKEIDGDIGDSTIGLQARMMGQAMRKITAIAEKYNTLIIFINQLREKIGVMFGSPETTSGGNALKFYASIRVDVRKSLNIEEELNKTTIKLVKNKVGKPFKKAIVDIVWGIGIDRKKEIVDLAVEMEIIEKGGKWFKYEGNQFDGKANFDQMLEDNPEVLPDIEGKVQKRLDDGYERPKEPAKEK